MTRKDFKRQHKRIRKLFGTWIYPLGLSWWRIDIVYHRRRKGFFHDHNRQTFARVFADWRYMRAQIDVCVPVAQVLKNDELEKAVVHELAHILVREAGNPKGVTDHEERVCTTLANAFIWTRDIMHVKEAKGAGKSSDSRSNAR